MKWHLKWREIVGGARLIVFGMVTATLGAPHAGFAQPPNPVDLINAFKCIVPGYGAVRLIAAPTLNNLALAERIAGSNELVIYVRRDLMMKFQPTTRVFWLEHECSHHRLGHTKGTGAVSSTCVAREEDAADCSAVQTMVNAAPPMIDVNGLAIIEKDLQRLPNSPDAIYKSGSERAAQVDRCARDDAWGARVIRAGDCALR